MIRLSLLSRLFADNAAVYTPLVGHAAQLARAMAAADVLSSAPGDRGDAREAAAALGVTSLDSPAAERDENGAVAEHASLASSHVALAKALLQVVIQLLLLYICCARLGGKLGFHLACPASEGPCGPC